MRSGCMCSQEWVGITQTDPAPFLWWGSGVDDFRWANLFFPGLKPESAVSVSFGKKTNVSRFYRRRLSITESNQRVRTSLRSSRCPRALCFFLQHVSLNALSASKGFVLPPTAAAQVVCGVPTTGSRFRQGQNTG